MKTVDFERVKVVPCLPDRFESGGEPIPAGLVGAEIVAIGTLEDNEAVEGGGLVIDYRKSPTGAVRRVVLAFNELGMWPVYRGRRSRPRK